MYVGRRFCTHTSVKQSGDKRLDGRGSDEFRPICTVFTLIHTHLHVVMRTGIVRAATGSAYVEFGDTKVICAVHGPRQTHKQQFSAHARVTCDYKVATFATPLRGEHQQVCRLYHAAFVHSHIESSRKGAE